MSFCANRLSAADLYVWKNVWQLTLGLDLCILLLLLKQLFGLGIPYSCQLVKLLGILVSLFA